MTRLTNISLQNFQSFREKVDIPIRSLTFLYGPNSAGKSAVYDALCVIDSLLHKPQPAYEGRDFSSLISRWGNPYVRGVNPQPVTVISARYEKSSWSCPCDLKDGLSYSLDALTQKLSDAKNIEVRIYSANLAIPTVEILIDDREAIRIGPSNSIADNESVIQKTTLIVNGSLMALVKPEAYSAQHDDVADESQRAVFVDVIHGPLRLNLTSLSASGHQAIAIVVARMVIECAKANVRLPDIVPGDRGLIPSDALGGMFKVRSFFYDGDHPDTYEDAQWLHLDCSPGLVDGDGPERSPSAFGGRFQIDSPADKVAASFFMQAVRENTDEIADAEFKSISMRLSDCGFGWPQRLTGPVDWADQLLHEFINVCFSDHLFRNGYKLAADITAFGFVGERADEGRFGGIKAGMVRWHLVDAARRTFTFEDVGSGVSCVLPVLVAAFEGGGFIQQPELHLHPALQSELGDIFISANRSRKGFHLIETHSEYPLLRCLRRIRETTAGKRSAQDPYALEADQIMVLYFDPQGDGSTRVIPIRISRQGDFIDRWPRGFFEERGRELFDE